MPAIRSINRALRSQHGYTLIEIMIAVVIALFLLEGLLTIVQNNRRVFGTQNQLAQLEDSQRLVMTMIADVVATAGYFPDPTTNTSAALTATGPFAAGQAIAGTYNAAAPGDTIRARYVTASGDGILNCSGLSNTSGANQIYVNVFRIIGGNLVCTMNGTQYPLVNGVTNFTVLYGVKTDFTVDDNTVDTYFNASQMAAANWSNVITVSITLTFTNPIAGAGAGQPATISFQRVVGVMNKAGIKI
jgi:type IV pilus assembly protein PilW